MNVGSLFTGGLGLDLGLQHAGHTLKWACDTDPACRTLIHHHHPGIPILTDVHHTDDWLEPVDLITGGFPCPDFSVAGKRLMFRGKRAQLWHEFARTIRLLQPRIVLVENVSGLLAGLGVILADLAQAGYVGEWFCLRASDLGAPHRRERLFVIARATPDTNRQRRRQITGSEPRQQSPHARLPQNQVHLPRRPSPSRIPTTNRAAPPHPRRTGSQRAEPEQTHRRSRPPHGNPEPPWGTYEPAIRRWERTLGRPAPRPTDNRGRLEPAFVEWMLGFPHGWTDVGLARGKRLQILGNAVQVQVAELIGHTL